MNEFAVVKSERARERVTRGRGRGGGGESEREREKILIDNDEKKNVFSSNTVFSTYVTHSIFTLDSQTRNTHKS